MLNIYYIKGEIVIFIYEIVNQTNNKRYIGKAKDFNRRKNRHLYELRHNRHHCLHLQRAWNKYGESNFIFNIIHSGLSEEEASKKEEELINLNYDNIYNISKRSDGGDLISYHPNREKIVKRMSTSLRKRYEEHPEIRDEYSKKFSGEGNPMYGKHHSDESKEKMSKTRLENPQEYSEERRKSISKIRTETYKNHPEIKEKISNSLKRKYEEDKNFKEKVRQSTKTRWENAEYREKMSQMSKKVAEKRKKPLYGDGIYYDSISSASIKNNIKHGTVLNRIKSDHFPSWYFV